MATANAPSLGLADLAARCRRRVDGRVLLGRADAGPEMGFGHVGRLGALLDAWVEAGGRAVLRTAGLRGGLRARLRRVGVRIVDAAAASLEDDLRETRELARREGASAVATDGYRFDPGYLAALRDERPVLAVDDRAAVEIVSDVLLNQNVGFPAHGYEAPAGTRVLVGPEYALLRREIRAALGAAEEPGVVGRLLVTFGGSDPAGLTRPTVEALLAALPNGVSLDVVLGPGVGSEVRQWLAGAVEGSADRLRMHCDVPDLADLMLTAQLAVSAAGTTTWELLALGVPTVLVAVADNQRVVVDGVRQHGAGVCLGRDEPDRPARIREAVLKLLDDPGRRRQMAERGRALFDGQGVWRAIEALLDAVERREAQR